MLNNVVLMGRLVADPELRHTPTNLPVTTFTIAVDRKYVKQGADRETDFIDIVAWRSTAEFITKYFHKGSMIAITGSIQTRMYTDKNDNKRKAFEVLADNVYFCGSKKDNAGGSGYDAGGMRGDLPQSQPAAYSSVELGDFEEIQDNDDDLPF